MVRKGTGMKRVDFYLAKAQVERIGRLSRTMGFSASEIMRRAIDEYCEKQESKKKGGGKG